MRTNICVKRAVNKHHSFTNVGAVWATCQHPIMLANGAMNIYIVMVFKLARRMDEVKWKLVRFRFG